ncbi:MAG: hypothetical protein K2X49_08965 [Acetobacteraceae bacterium]|nr:hypothetical protein [Acetobacteraceae bacterium]
MPTAMAGAALRRTWDPVRRPVGLLLAAGGDTASTNKIHHVLDALDIALVTYAGFRGLGRRKCVPSHASLLKSPT